jgi:hypothetical protein
MGKGLQRRSLFLEENLLRQVSDVEGGATVILRSGINCSNGWELLGWLAFVIENGEND